MFLISEINGVCCGGWNDGNLDDGAKHVVVVHIEWYHTSRHMPFPISGKYYSLLYVSHLLTTAYLCWPLPSVTIRSFAASMGSKCLLRINVIMMTRYYTRVASRSVFDGRDGCMPSLDFS